MRARLLVAALLAGFLSALLVGCGINTEDAGRPEAEGSTQTTPGGSTVDEEAARRLPKRPDGVVEVQGPVQGSLTPVAIRGVQGVRVNYAPTGASEGFRDLCEGRIDVLDTSRQITEAEQRLCKRNGVELADSIQVASDAVVIATPNENDVGGDCLRMSTVNEIFRAGSPINNWNQVGFFDLPLRVTGGPADSPAFQFFAQLVLGVPSSATLANVRSDYLLRGTDDGVRREVTSETRIARVRERYGERIRDLELQRDIEFQLAVDRAVNDARDRMLAIFDQENDRLADREVELSEFQKREIARRNRRRINSAIEQAQNRAIARFSFPRLRFLRARYRRDLREARRLGTIGIFRFSYYELYENSLRPMEIWDPERAAVALERMNGVTVERDGETAGTSTTPGETSTSTSTTPTTTTPTTTSTTATTTTATTTTPASSEDPLREEDGEVVVNADRTPWCVFPSQQTITNQSYPLSRPFLLYVAKFNLRREEVQTFLRSYLERSEQLARQNRLVPIPESVRTRNLGIIDLDRTPGIADEDDQTETTTTSTTPNGALPGVGQGTTQSTTPTVTGGPATTPSTTTTAP